MILLVIFTFADALFFSGDFYRAAGEYRRELFINPENAYAAMKLGDAYYKLGYYNLALFWYGRAYYLCEDKEVQERYIYLLAKTMKIEDLMIMIEDKGHPLIQGIKELNKPSPVRYISFVIPGGTQIFCGEYRTGMLSLLWNALSIYLGYRSIKNRDLPGIILSLSLFKRFYMGNLNSAKAAIHRKKLKVYEGIVKLYKPDFF